MNMSNKKISFYGSFKTAKNHIFNKKSERERMRLRWWISPQTGKLFIVPIVFLTNVLIWVCLCFNCDQNLYSGSFMSASCQLHVSFMSALCQLYVSMSACMLTYW